MIKNVNESPKFLPQYPSGMYKIYSGFTATNTILFRQQVYGKEGPLRTNVDP